MSLDLAGKVTVKVRACLLENVLCLELTLQWHGSHLVYVELLLLWENLGLGPVHSFCSFCLFFSWFGEF